MPAPSFKTAVAVTVLCALAAACADRDTRSGGEAPGSALVATVGSVAITLDDLNRRFDRYRTQLRIDKSASSSTDYRLRNIILYRMIDETLLELEARRRGVTVSDGELEKEIHLLLGAYDQAKLGLALAKNEMGFDEWREEVKKGLRIKKLVIQEIDSKIEVTEKEVEEHYKNNADQFKWPERVRALQIMVKDETTAEQIRKKLLNGVDFATMAKERSESPDAVSGGDLGFFSRGQMPPEFETAVFTLQVGQISEVIESIYGFHLFKVVRREGPRGMTYPEARERIHKLLFDTKREKEFKNWIATIKESIPITLHAEPLLRASS